MSVLVMFDSATLIDGFESLPVSELSSSSSYREALEYWGEDDILRWVAVTDCHGRSWDDLINWAIEEAEGVRLLKNSLVLLAQSCNGMAIWYAGFPDDIPLAEGPDEFVDLVISQLLKGEVEPAARMITPRPW